MAQAFSESISELVQSVTDEAGHNRKGRKRLTNEKLSRLPAASIALRVKLADRVANVRSCVQEQNKGLLRMYQNFRAAVYRPESGGEDLWEELGQLLK